MYDDLTIRIKMIAKSIVKIPRQLMRGHLLYVLDRYLITSTTWK